MARLWHGQVQPRAVPGVGGRGEPGGPAGLELLDPVLDVGLGAVPDVEVLDLPGGGVGGERAVAPVRVLPQGRLLPGRPGCAAGEDAHVGRPPFELVPAGTAAQQPGQLDHLRIEVHLALRGQPRRPVALTGCFDRGAGAGIDGPPDGVLDAPTAGTVRLCGVQLVQVLDQAVGGAGAVDGDQDVAAVGCGDLVQGGVEDGDVVGRGERAGRPEVSNGLCKG